ncbi:hypothetical protein [Roseibium sp. RKSG952]|uniref:hypothetical protein n=1 Tax=Roseibium sp. RKSG952 TaxID=2529384 RepID=UPI0012BC7D5C|nr:hypothetical protein [Roseibium sp. RKSG952]MTH95985.1 hypothetical protein [Roseibium sp. RKSG952]
MASIGAPDHVEIAGYISRADKYRLNDGARDRIAETRRRAVWSIEQNLDVIRVPDVPIWVEWRGLPSFMNGDQGKTGFLAVANPTAEQVVSFITAWEDGQGARHAYAFASINLAAAYHHAYEARRFFSKIQDESLERIMGLVMVTISDGFSDELSILTDGDHRVNEAAMRDGSAEIPFILGVLESVLSPGALTVEGEDSPRALGWSAPKRSLVDRGRDVLGIGNPLEFRRKLDRETETAAITLL